MAAGEASAKVAAAGMSMEAEMELDFSRVGVLPSFEFAFNSANFSDRKLQIEIVPDVDVGGGSAGEEKGDKGQSIDASSMKLSTPVLREKTIYINSAVLASKSPFFLKLFSNGMKESDQKHPTFRITDSEENSLMELLSYMYSGKLTRTEPILLLDVLKAADKFEVLSCMSHCIHLLTSLPMTTESALLYLEHLFSVSTAAEVQPLIVAAKEFLANKYKDFTKFQRDLMNLPLVGIEAIFSSTDLQVMIEDEIYTFMLEWARGRYPDLEERRMILSSRLLPLVRFNHMSCDVLREVLTSADDDIDHDQVNKCITEVLLHKAYPAHAHGYLTVDVPNCWQPEERSYIFKPVKLVAFGGAYPQVIAYWDLKREECSQFFPSEQCHHTGVLSYPLRHAGLDMSLIAQCIRNSVSGLYSFGLFLHVKRSSKRVTLEYEFSARTNASGKFVSRFEGKASLTGDSKLGCSDVFGTAWSTFITDDSLFIDGVLHLRVDWTVVEQSELST